MRGLKAPPRRTLAPAAFDRLRGLEELVARLDGAGPGGEGQRPVADRDVADPDDRVLGVELARGELEGPARPGDRRDARAGRRAARPGARPRRRPRRGRPRPRAPRRGSRGASGPPRGRPPAPRSAAPRSPRPPSPRTSGLASHPGRPSRLPDPPGSRPSSSAAQKKKQRSCGLCSHPARPPPELTLRGGSCRARKVEVVRSHGRGHDTGRAASVKARAWPRTRVAPTRASDRSDPPSGRARLSGRMRRAVARRGRIEA